MPRGFLNWRFEDVAAFLRQHFFVEIHTRGSHHYYRGFVDKQFRVVEVQYHSGESIKPRTLRHGVIVQSGIPESVWKRWGSAGQKRLRRRIQYRGATMP